MFFKKVIKVLGEGFFLLAQTLQVEILYKIKKLNLYFLLWRGLKTYVEGLLVVRGIYLVWWGLRIYRWGFKIMQTPKQQVY
jgi:hypothetical protein